MISTGGHFEPSRYINRSAISGTLIFFFSPPSGISDVPVFAISFSVFFRRMFSVTLSARLSVMLFAVSSAMTPVLVRPVVGRDDVLYGFQGDLPIGIENMRHHLFRECDA